jgi:hypothetical protein
MLVLRYLSGFRGDQLVHDAVAQDCERCDSDRIWEYLQGIDDQLDVDDNRVSDALTDGLLVARYLFGFRGELLTTGAVGNGCKRCTAEQIETYLDTLVVK